MDKRLAATAVLLVLIYAITYAVAPHAYASIYEVCETQNLAFNGSIDWEEIALAFFGMVRPELVP